MLQPSNLEENFIRVVFNQPCNRFQKDRLVIIQARDLPLSKIALTKFLKSCGKLCLIIKACCCIL